MHHLICRAERFEIDAPYTLRIDFDDSTQQVVDFLPVLRDELYGPLHDLELFNQVKLDPEVRTLVWPNGADFDPATLHEWPSCAPAFAEMANARDSVSDYYKGEPRKSAPTSVRADRQSGRFRACFHAILLSHPPHRSSRPRTIPLATCLE